MFVSFLINDSLPSKMSLDPAKGKKTYVKTINIQHHDMGETVYKMYPKYDL